LLLLKEKWGLKLLKNPKKSQQETEVGNDNNKDELAQIIQHLM